ncbi:MAG TPA: hypothetical protein VFI13_01755, partial [Gemmatimonadales bacterium]|nr:hypothetical protein [Gemmatimonadales bacterium]
LDWRDARQGFGWKWAVEHALRRHGYVSDTPPLSLAFRTHHRVATRPRRSGSGRIAERRL